MRTRQAPAAVSAGGRGAARPTGNPGAARVIHGCEDWHPVASSGDLPYRHVYQARLLGVELAAWRADDDFVNVWENRCLHRGVRLSIGISDGFELKCQYHGWRYASRTAGCTYIPAHPSDAVAQTICNRTYPAQERYGLVWTTLAGGAAAAGHAKPLPRIAVLEGAVNLPMRAVEVWAPADLVGSRIEGLAGAGGEWERLTGEAIYFVQPADSNRCVVRGLLPDPVGDLLALLRDCDGLLTRLRDEIEAEAETAAEAKAAVPSDGLGGSLSSRLRRAPTGEMVLPEMEAPSSRFASDVPEPPESAQGEPEERTAAGRRASLRTVVARKWAAGEGVAAFELKPLEGMLPAHQPGAHIDVHLPNGLVRQYSLVNGPGDGGRYVIGVKLEPDSAGGSECLHHVVREGDVLAVSEPRNNFVLRRDAARTVLVAGGIGATPLLSMALTLSRSRLPFEFHAFARSEGHLAFAAERAEVADATTAHLGLSGEQTAARVREILGSHTEAAHVYVCGPAPMLEAARSTAADLGWPDDAVHFEYFANPNEIDYSSSFEVALARSAVTLTVETGQTILEALRASGVAVASSCEQGACGTCVVAVLEGEPDHQDVYLNASERARGDRIMTCVSRALSERLVLDA